VDVQGSAVIVDRVGEVSINSLDEHLTAIKLEDHVGEPPLRRTLHALPLTRGAACRRAILERLLDSFGYGDARGCREPSTYNVLAVRPGHAIR
jgi:hypothetical protein